MSLLLRSEISELSVNTLSADGKYFCHYKKNLAQQRQLQLSKKSKVSSGNFIAFVKYTSHSRYFEKKDEPHSLSISDIFDSERGCYLNV